MKAQIFSHEKHIGTTELHLGDESMGCLYGDFIPTENYFKYVQQAVWEFWSQSKPDYHKWDAIKINVQLDNGYFLFATGGFTIDDVQEFQNELKRIDIAGVDRHVIEDFFLQTEPALLQKIPGMYSDEGMHRRHQYKNLSIDFPSHWVYELEEGDLQACFDPESHSTLRIHVLKLIHRELTADQHIESLTNKQAYRTTSKGHILTSPIYFDTIDGDQNITLMTWRLINNTSAQKLLAVFSYTVLSEEVKSAREIDAITMIENSLNNADLA